MQGGVEELSTGLPASETTCLLVLYLRSQYTLGGVCLDEKTLNRALKKSKNGLNEHVGLIEQIQIQFGS